jgi:hypothetical protein
MRFILGKQASDGSFSSPYVATTMQVTPVLIGVIPRDINTIQCPKNVSEGNKNVSIKFNQEFSLVHAGRDNDTLGLPVISYECGTRYGID